MSRFIYKSENGEVHLEIQNMDLKQAAAEVGHVVERLYISLKQQDPEAADFFRFAVIVAISHPDSPVWKGEHDNGDAITLIMGKKQK